MPPASSGYLTLGKFSRATHAADVDSLRLSIPGPGRSLARAAEERGRHVRYATSVLADTLCSHVYPHEYRQLLGNRFLAAEEPLVSEPLHVRTAWALVNQWLLGRRIGKLTQKSSFEDAEAWFLDHLFSRLPRFAPRIPKDAQLEAIRSLEIVASDDHFSELLPYILEPHGPGSRLSVMRDPTTAESRAKKKRHGVFFTPTDVTEYMVSETLGHVLSGATCARILDPACGTGAFLVASISAIFGSSQSHDSRALSLVLDTVFGIDASALAVENCTFVILHQLLGELEATKAPPWSVWHAIRMNLSASDACRVKASEPNQNASLAGVQRLLEQRHALREMLMAGEPGGLSTDELPINSQPRQSKSDDIHLDLEHGGLPIHYLFPELANGADVLIGNPPYAILGTRPDSVFLASEYQSLVTSKISGTEQIYTLFVEMTWRLTKPGHSASALVLPLSIAYHRGNQFQACRKALSTAGGLCRFAFFDREPHALFGEDVKTRNAILFRFEHVDLPTRGARAQMETTPLIRWTSRTRSNLFSSIKYTPLRNRHITKGIPKIGSHLQSAVLAKLSSRTDALESLAFRFGSCQLSRILQMDSSTAVYVSGTAYNFLNVFRSVQVPAQKDAAFSTSPVHLLTFSDGRSADIAFAILSSRLAYWLWLALCDGFHVPRWFLMSVPFGSRSFTPDQELELAAAGSRLWQKVGQHPAIAVNGGRITVSFKPDRVSSERDRIDAVLAEAADVPFSFLNELKNLIRQMVVIDYYDERRTRLLEPLEMEQRL